MIQKIKQVDFFNFTIFIFAIFLASTSFFVYSAIDQQFSYGKKTEVSVLDIPSNKTKQEVQNFIEKTAKDTNQNIFLLTNAGNGTTKTISFAFIGNQSLYNKYYKNNIYPAFDKSYQVIIKKYTQIGTHELRGTYQFSCDKVQLNSIILKWNKWGIKTAFPSSYGSPLDALSCFASGITINNFNFLFVILLVGILFASFASMISKSKQFVIQKINGLSNGAVFKKHIYKIAKSYLVCLVLVAGVTTIFLAIYNGLNQFLDFLIHFLLCAFIFFFILVFLQIIAFGIVLCQKSLLFQIKGKRTAKLLMVVACIAQILIFFIIITNLSAIKSSYNTNKIEQQNLSKFNEVKNYSYLSMSINAVKDGLNKAAIPVENFTNKLDKQNKVILTARQQENLGDVKDPDPQNPFAYIPPSNSLIVNNEFLNLQSIYSTNGAVIKNLNFNQTKINTVAFVLIPESKKSLQQNIVKHAKQFFLNQYAIMEKKEKIQKANIKQIKVKAIFIKANQTVANYNNGVNLVDGIKNEPISSQVDPIILVVDIKDLSASGLMSYMSSEQLLFSNSANIQAEIDKAGAGKYVLQINNVADRAVFRLQSLEKTQENNICAVVLAFIILLFSSILISMIYCDANKQVLFAKFSNGHSFLYSIKAFLLTVFLCGFVIADFCIYTKQVIGVENIFISFCIILLNLVVLGIAGKYYYNKMNATFVKRY